RRLGAQASFPPISAGRTGGSGTRHGVPNLHVRRRSGYRHLGRSLGLRSNPIRQRDSTVRAGEPPRRGREAGPHRHRLRDGPGPEKNDDPFEKARWETLKLLRDRLLPCDWDATRQDASPESLGSMMAKLAEE